MKFRWKLFISLLLGTLLLNVALYLSAQQFLLPVMAQLELERVEGRLALGSEELLDFVEGLHSIAEDNASWDETYAFAETGSLEFVASNYVKSFYRNFKMELMLILNSQGDVLYEDFYDDDSDTLTGVPDELLQTLLQESRLWDFGENNPHHVGFFLAGDQVFALVAEPILTSDGDGPARGVLLMGRILDSHSINAMDDYWGDDVSLELLAPGQEWDSDAPFSVELTGDSLFRGSINVPDLFGRPLLKLKSSFSREFYLQGKNILDTTTRWNSIISLCFALICYLAIDRALRSRELRLLSESRYEKLSTEFETILNGIPSALSHISPDLKVLWANRAGAALLTEASPVGNGRYVSSVEFVSGSNVSESAVELCLKSKANEVVTAESGDGSVFKEYAYPLLNDKEEVASVIRIVVDITEPVRMKNEAAQNSRLAAIGELAAGVAHEINNPIGMILINLGLLTDVHADLVPILDEQLEHNPNLELGQLSYPVLRKKLPYLLKEMTAGGLRIKGIVEDLKGFARKDIGEDMEIVDIKAVVEAAVRLVTYQLGKATADFTENYTENPAMVRGNFRRLEQVVVNLLINATQALETREQRICIRTGFSENMKNVVVEVEDGGRGIARENIEKILDPFFTTRRNNGGTGLGLSLSARIAEEHGGSLRVYSTPGAKTVIGLHLPVIEEKS